MDMPRLRLASSNARNNPRTPAPNRRLLLVISHGFPPDALDREWEVVVEKYPHFRHSIVQLKHAIRERGSGSARRSDTVVCPRGSG
jgi:hypothetical protein